MKWQFTITDLLEITFYVAIALAMTGLLARASKQNVELRRELEQCRQSNR